MPRKPPTQSIVNILHLSDLHRGHNAPTSNLVLQGRIKDDILKNYAQDNNRFQLGEPRLGPPDLIVISGDLTQRADPGEFQLAAEFLESLLELVGGERRRIILVPGNHDVNWNLSRLAFSEVSEQDYKDQPEFDDPYRQLVKKARDKPEYWRKDETKYLERFRPFQEFFDAFYQGAYRYPLDRSRMYNIYDFSAEFGLVIVGLNTCDEIDHLDRRAFINTEAIENACAEPAFHNGETRLLRLAVYHHNIRSVHYGEDFLDPRYLQVLKHKGFKLCLHGHVHTAGHDIFDPTHAQSLPLLGSGSLAAPYADRPPATPRGYNLLALDRKQGSLHAHTRRQDENHLIWQADYQWEGKPYVVLYPPCALPILSKRQPSKKPTGGSNAMFTNLIIVSPEGWRYETRVLNDTPVAQLTQAFVQTCWKPDPDRFSYRFHLRPLDPGRPSLENLKSLQESGIITGSSLRLETELLKDDAAVALTIQDEDDQRYTTAVLLNTTIAHLAEAFLQEHPGPGELRVDLISGIVDPKVVRQLNPQFSLFAEGIDDYAILRIYRTTQSSQE